MNPNHRIHTVNHYINNQSATFPQIHKKKRPESGKRTHLSIIPSARRKQRLKRVIAGNQETRKVNEEVGGDVEENKEKVNADQTQDHVDLRDGALALQVVEDGVFGELLRSEERQN